MQTVLLFWMGALWAPKKRLTGWVEGCRKPGFCEAKGVGRGFFRIRRWSEKKCLTSRTGSCNLAEFFEGREFLFRQQL